jgi:hypothetical protein
LLRLTRRILLALLFHIRTYLLRGSSSSKEGFTSSITLQSERFEMKSVSLGPDEPDEVGCLATVERCYGLFGRKENVMVFKGGTKSDRRGHG